MQNETVFDLANHLIKTFNSDRVVMKNFIERIIGIVSDEPDKDIEKVGNIWKDYFDRSSIAHMNMENEVHIIPSYRKNMNTEEVNSYPIEKKILINYDIFKSKLKDVDVLALNDKEEILLIKELHQLSIGLTFEEVEAYHKIIKIEHRPNNIKESADCDSIFGSIIELIENNFFSLGSLITINNSQLISRHNIKNALRYKVNNKLINPKVLDIMLGSDGNMKYIHMIKLFFYKIGIKWGDNPDEIIKYFLFYLLFHDISADILDKLNISRSLANFLTTEADRMKMIYYAGIIFMHSFLYILINQTIEISHRVNDNSIDNKSSQKLIKAVSSTDKLKHLFKISIDMALGKISKYTIESREIQETMSNIVGSKLILEGKDFIKKYNCNCR